MQSGYAEYLAIRESFNLPLLETGAMVVAWSEAERTALDGIEAQARRNGVNDIRRLTAAEIRAREPELSPRALEALLIPGEHIIDPWSPFLAYTLQAMAHGAEIAFATEVVSGAFDGEVWTLRTNGGAWPPGRLSIAPGFMATSWTRAFSEPHRFRSGRERVNSSSSTRRRQAFSARSSCRCPSERTKGVVFSRTIFGNVLVGPTAEEQEDRERATVEENVLRGLIARASRHDACIGQGRGYGCLCRA